MSYIVIIGNPISGHNYYGPFDNVDEAAEYQEQTNDGSDWWVAPLVTPEDESPTTESTWEPTHYSVKDGSGAVMVLGNKFNRTITLVNENGDQWTDPISEWEPA